MKKISLLMLFITSLTYSQNYFYDDFNYPSFSEIDSLYINKPRKTIWSTNFSQQAEDISENGVIDFEEIFKKTAIVPDPLDTINKVIRFELNKIDPYFYAKHACDDPSIDNLLRDEILTSTYNPERDIHCVGCNKSPLKVFAYHWKNKMNRNEISSYGRRKLYKINRDYWFGFKSMIGEKYELETHKNPELIAQFIGENEDLKYPLLSLRIENDRYVAYKRLDDKGAMETIDLGQVEKQKWVTWRFHLNYSKKDKKGVIEIYKNDEPLYLKRGQNIEMRSKYYLKVGIYKWAWWSCSFPESYTKKKVVYFDKIWASKKSPILIAN